MRSFTITFSTSDPRATDVNVADALNGLAADNGFAVAGLTVRSEVAAVRTISEAEYQELINRAGR